jgi:hypothetical protein
MRKQRKSHRVSLAVALASWIGGALPAMAQEESERAEAEQSPDRQVAASWLDVRVSMAELPSEHIFDSTAFLAPTGVSAALTTATSQPRVLEPHDFQNNPLGQSRGGFFAAMGVGMFAASAGDLATTELGLARAGITESNPFQRNRLVRLSTHAAVPALLWWTTDRLHARGKTKLALIMRIGFTAAYGYAVLHNTRSMGGRP